MARDTWQLIRPVVQTKKNNKKVTIPAFSYSSFYTRKSIGNGTSPGSDDFYQSLVAEYSMDGPFTLEFWVKLSSISGSHVLFQNWREASNANQLTITATATSIVIDVSVSSSTETLTATYPVPANEWFHIGVTFDATTIRLYVNGKLQSTTLDPTGGVIDTDIANTYGYYMFGTKAGGSLMYGSIAELRFDSTQAIGEETMAFRWDKVISEDDLALRISFADAAVAGSFINFTELVTSSSKSITASKFSISETDYPPIGFGCAPLIAEYEVSIGEPCSLKHPKAHPETTPNWGLYVSWIDDGGEFQRRKLFAPSSMDLEIAPVVALYDGEKVNDPFKLEVFAKDGEDTITLTSDLDIKLSNTSNPTSGTDHANNVADEIAADTTLGEPTPLSNPPYEFNTQQTF